MTCHIKAFWKINSGVKTVKISLDVSLDILKIFALETSKTFKENRYRKNFS